MKTLFRRKLTGFLLPVSVLLVPALSEAQNFPPDEDIELMLRYIVEDTGTPGIMLGLLEGDGTARIVSYGSAGKGAQPLGPRSLFEIGSLTKSFVGALLADMAARGEVALEDPVSKYLPPHVTVPSNGGREITLVDLATHRSALPVWPGRGPGARLSTLSDFTLDDLYDWLSGHQLRGVPGTGYAYSNLGYGLLGHALAQAAGMPLSELLHERILSPLGMEATHIPDHGEVNEAMVRGHRRGAPGPYSFTTEAIQGAGAMVSNIEELLIFLRAALAPPETDLERAIQSALEVRVPDGTQGAGWGFSWRSGIFPSGALLTGQGGATESFKSRIVLDRARGAGVVILANDFFFDEPLESILLGHEPRPSEWADIDVERQVLASYVGEYVGVDESRRYFLRLEEAGFLTYQTPDRPRARLYALSDTAFYTLRAPWTFTLQAPADETAATMVVMRDERRGDAERETRTARKVAEETPSPAAVAGFLPAVEVERRATGSDGVPGLLVVLAVAAMIGLVLVSRLRWSRQ